jgi:hypothetical protein
MLRKHMHSTACTRHEGTTGSTHPVRRTPKKQDPTTTPSSCSCHPCCNQEAAAGRRQDVATVTLHAAAGLPIHTYCLPALPCTAVEHLMQSTCLQLWHNVTTVTGEVTCHMHEDQALLC